MQQLKQIIISRIVEIKTLQKLQSQSNIITPSRYHTILLRKNDEDRRSAKEIQLLACNFDRVFQPSNQCLFGFVKQVCFCYDGDIEIGDGDLKTRLFVLLKNFFYKHDFRQKLPYLKTQFVRHAYKISASMILNLLSEWSKKMYMKIVNMQLKTIKKQYLYKSLQHESPTNRQQQMNGQSKDSIGMKSRKSLVNRLNSMKSENSISQRPQKFKKGSLASINSGKILTIYNRETLYSYISEELDCYYQLTGIQNLDLVYIKGLNRRKMKQNLYLPENMNRGIQILINSGSNKQIKNIIQIWKVKGEEMRVASENRQKIRYKQKQKQLLLKKEDSIKIFNTTTNLQNQNHKSRQIFTNEKKLSMDIKIQHRQSVQVATNHQVSRASHKSVRINKNLSILLDNNHNYSEEYYENVKNNLSREFMEKARNVKLDKQREKIKDKQDKKNRIKLPILSRSMEKEDRGLGQIEKTKIVRFTTQQSIQDTEIANSIYKKDEQIQPQWKQFPRFKFIQRQTIKGIIIKNFLSNRQRLKTNNIKVTQCKSARKQSDSSNKHEEKSKNMETQHKKMTDCVDIRSLRQKTRALLKNFNTLQNYLN